MVLYSTCFVSSLNNLWARSSVRFCVMMEGYTNRKHSVEREKCNWQLAVVRWGNPWLGLRQERGTFSADAILLGLIWSPLSNWQAAADVLASGKGTTLFFYTASAWWKVATKMQTTHECTSQPYHLGAGFMPIYSYHSTLTGTESQGWPLESEMMRLKSGGLTGFMAFCCIDVAQKCVVMLQQNCHSVSSQSGQHYNTSRTRGKNWKQNK